MYHVKTIALIFSMFLICSCKTTPIHEGSFYIDKRIPEAQRRDAVISTAKELGWGVAFPKKGVYRVQIHNRDHRATFDVVCKKSSCATRYVSSQNLKYNAAKHTIHRNYNKWVKTFIDRLTVKLRVY